MRRSFKRFDGQQASAVIAAVALLAVSFVCGGTSRNNELRLLLVELSALPLIGMAVLALSKSGDWRSHRLAIGLALGALAIPLLQLIPLPPGVWTRLPGRDELVLALGVADIVPGWSTVSLTPDATLAGALALVPALAMFGGALTLRESDQRRLLWVVLGLTGVSMAVALLQFVGGARFHVWAETRDGSVAGLFMNRNHLATLCLTALPFLAVLAARDLRPHQHAPAARPWLTLLFGVGVVGVIALTRSRAGLMLFPVAVGGSVLAAWIAAGLRRPSRNQLILIGLACAVLLALAALAFGPTMARLEAGGAHDIRFERWPQVVTLAQTYLPLGSGVGSFDPAYRAIETLQELDSTYFNNAHNDYLEIWLETGWLGVALILGFLWWFGKRSLAAWRSGDERADLPRAASVAILIVLLHSIGDYPLRTATMAVVFALACAILEFASRAPSSGRRRRRAD